VMRVPEHGQGQLRVGNPGNRGGTGRPPNAIRELAATIAEKHKLVERLGEIGGGDDVMQFKGVAKDKDGNEIPVVDCAPARVGDQIDATELLLAYAHGRPPQSVDVTGDIEHTFVLRIPRRAQTAAEWLEQRRREEAGE
jgi:hypothetical protein